MVHMGEWHHGLAPSFSQLFRPTNLEQVESPSFPAEIIQKCRVPVLPSRNYSKFPGPSSRVRIRSNPRLLGPKISPAFQDPMNVMNVFDQLVSLHVTS